MIGVQATTGASVHGSDQLPGSKPPTCTPPRKSFKVVADQQGEKKPQALKGGAVRVCFIIRSFGPQAQLSLDAQFATLRARR